MQWKELTGVTWIRRIAQSRRLASVKSLEQERRWRPGENGLQMVGLILYLAHISELLFLKKVQALFLGKGTKCRIYIYLENIKMEIPDELLCEEMLIINHNSVNWYGLVPSGYIDSFLKEPFDLIVDLSKEYFFTTTYMALVAKATVKIGRYIGHPNPYGIVLDTKQSDDEDAFIELLDNCLQFIRIE